MNNRLRLRDFVLTRHQSNMITNYCNEMDYTLMENSNLPFICKSDKRVPIQLIDGNVVAVANKDRFDLMQLYCSMQQTKRMLINMCVLPDKQKAGKYLLKGVCCMMPLEL